LYTVDTALESLKKYDIRESDLLAWERELDLEIVVDEYGRKQYSPHHINLFKNIKKHIALGRTISEIKQIINLPPLKQSRPQMKPNASRPTPPISRSQVARESQQPIISPTQQPVMPPQPQLQPQQQIQQPAQPMMQQQQIPHARQAQPQMTRPQAQQPVMSRPQAPNAAALSEMSMPPARQANAQDPAMAIGMEQNAYAAAAKRPSTARQAAAPVNAGAANVVNLVQRLTREKDQLYKKLLETEKLNSHLYSANNLFHKKVREMAQQIVDLRESADENEKFKLMDDKARLHKQLLEAEKLALQRQDELQNQRLDNERTLNLVQKLQEKIHAMSTAFEPDKFRGDWMENAQLVEVIYDNFGINIDSERVRLFRISEIPARLYGRMSVINTSYQYETNALWKRDESLLVSYIDEHTLEGELTAEYILDGVPVAKALYRVTCRRKQDKLSNTPNR
jgi:DNA-binding transcriptional MerR regulator